METSRIHVEAGPGGTIVHLEGEIDSALRAQASLSMATVLGGDGPVLIDATEATFVDSTGIAFVLQVQHAASEALMDITLRDPHHVVRDVLEVLGASHLLRDADGGAVAAVR
ncbi:STAS domain-containing protein [Cellulomonas composti]|uniref:STAS domain-containing protein n=1 Tax=Cellulomonas composti TaxID=266130 RepID=A0A511J9Z5_9CELL|nr:STAS domain-containing protein [Cellulomonas composti]GEL94811.1 hypothetical protein CCO02nite_14690 [Cellulomonas composti]